MHISDHTFLVTGAASGLGAGTARMLVGAGGNVIMADMNVAQGEALAKELGSSARFVNTSPARPRDRRPHRW